MPQSETVPASRQAAAVGQSRGATAEQKTNLSEASLPAFDREQYRQNKELEKNVVGRAGAVLSTLHRQATESESKPEDARPRALSETEEPVGAVAGTAAAVAGRIPTYNPRYIQQDPAYLSQSRGGEFFGAGNHIESAEVEQALPPRGNIGRSSTKESPR